MSDLDEAKSVMEDLLQHFQPREELVLRDPEYQARRDRLHELVKGMSDAEHAEFEAWVSSRGDEAEDEAS